VRYAFHDVTLDSELPLPEVPRSTRRRPGTITIRLAAAGAPRAPCWFHHWREGRRRSISFARLDDGYLLRCHGLADFHVAADGAIVRCDARKNCPAATLRHLLLDQVMPLVLALRGAIVLHGSGVHIDGIGVVAFVGAAGAGKSTLAAALGVSGHQIVADDSLVVRRLGARPVVVPGYPGARLWRDATRGLGLPTPGTAVAHYTSKRRVVAPALPFRRAAGPLKAIFVLGRRRGDAGARVSRATAAPAAIGRPVAPRDRLIALTRCAFVLDVQDRAQLAAMFSGLAWLVSCVPVLRLHLRDGRRHLPRAAGAVAALSRAAVDP
jgi:hypothetical protein